MGHAFKQHKTNSEHVDSGKRGGVHVLGLHKTQHKTNQHPQNNSCKTAAFKQILQFTSDPAHFMQILQFTVGGFIVGLLTMLMFHTQ